jgi:hypothetical protein
MSRIYPSESPVLDQMVSNCAGLVKEYRRDILMEAMAVIDCVKMRCESMEVTPGADEALTEAQKMLLKMINSEG